MKILVDFIATFIWDAFKNMVKLGFKQAFDWNPLFPC